MIIPAKYDLIIRNGEDFSFVFDIDVDGVTLDLSAATVESQIRETRDRAGTIIDAFTVAISVANEVTLSLNDTETLAITKSGGYYDVAVTIGTTTNYYLEGKVTFTNSITVPA